MSIPTQSKAMYMPSNENLPLFVYGALKPGLPAFETVRQWVRSFASDSVTGELFVRDGLPLLRTSQHGVVEGHLLHWHSGMEREAYAAICAFEPRTHYMWSEVMLQSGAQANALAIRFPNKGNPQHLESSSWKLSDDPAFGPGLDEVQCVLAEVDQMLSNSSDSDWQLFFRSQMAYLLLWSILERLSALCFGPGLDPMERVIRLPELRGMPEVVKTHVHRSDKVSDSRNPDQTYRLNADNAKSSFLYYYQIRSNLSHRGKGMFNEFNKVHSSLRELLAITRQFLFELQQNEAKS